MTLLKKNIRLPRFAGKVAALSLCAVLVTGMLAVFPGFQANAKSNAEIQSEINTLNSKMSRITKEQKELKNQIAGAKAQASGYSAQITDITHEIDLIDEQITVIEAMLVQYDELTAAQAVQIAELEVEIEKQQHVLDDMIRMSYEYGGAASSIEFIFSAENFTDLLSRIDLLSYHLSYNDKVLETYTATLESLETTKAEYEAAKVTMKEYKDEQEKLRADLQVKQANAAAMREKVLADAASYEAELAQKQAYINELNDEVKRLAAMFAKEDTTTYTGTFKFPLPANVYRITSYYGTRKDPFTGKTASHTGYDFACAKGTEIYAADDGTVVIAKYNGSYGNCVTINHGGGIMSLYGHCSSINVVSGQQVKRGDVIAYVGSTGRSTGNHLHFSVFKNGKLIDPAPYIGLK